MTKAIRITPVIATIIFLPTDERKNDVGAVTGMRSSSRSAAGCLKIRSRPICVKPSAKAVAPLRSLGSAQQRSGAKPPCETETPDRAGLRANYDGPAAREKTFPHHPEDARPTQRRARVSPG